MYSNLKGDFVIIMKDNKSYKKLSKFELILTLLTKSQRDDIFALASQMAYYLILSFFPFLMFLFTLLGFSKFDANSILKLLDNLMPTSVFELIESTVNEIVSYQSTGLLGISILLTIWTASSGFRAVLKGINKAYNIHENRGFIKRSIISYISTIALALIIIATLALLVFGDIIGNHLINILPFHHLVLFIWNLFRYGLILIVLIFILAITYKFAPSKKIKWKEAFPGAIITTFGWLIISVAFSFYINNFSNYSKIYGSLAAVFILMIWLFLISIIFLFGLEFNSVLSITKK